MSYQLKVIKDTPIGFWPLDETSGTTASDISGCGNNGTYSGSITTDIMPLISGGVSASKITDVDYITFNISNDYNGTLSSGGLATENNSDNDFSLEIWLYSNITTTNLTPILADDTNNIGIYFQNGNIVFLAGTQRLDYTVPYLKKTMHIVATYTQESLTLYVNGEYVNSLSLDSFVFINEEFIPQIGPTQSSLDSFIIDAPAIYRYALRADQVYNHYAYNKPINVGQIVKPDRGYLFEISDINIHPSFLYRLPADRSLDGYIGSNTDVYYDSKNKLISFIKTDTEESKTFVIEDFFSIPSGSGLISSKIDWYADNGIAVETSTDGINYLECTNGEAIPQYKLGADTFSIDFMVYFRVTMTSLDTSKYLPEFKYLAFNFYNNKNVTSNNSGMIISSKEPLAGDIDLTTWDYFLGCDNFPTLSRNAENGIKPSQAGFYINSTYEINSVEMLFRPIDLVKNTLIYSEYDSNTISYLWSNSGAITKSNIDYIYVNGVDRTSATNISAFLKQDEIHHIVIGFTQPASGDIWFNAKVSSNTWTSGGGRHLYNNIALYEVPLDTTKAQEHYYLYTDRASVSGIDNANQSVTMTEESVMAYDNDWLVIKNV